MRISYRGLGVLVALALLASLVVAGIVARAQGSTVTGSVLAQVEARAEATEAIEAEDAARPTGTVAAESTGEVKTAAENEDVNCEQQGEHEGNNEGCAAAAATTTPSTEVQRENDQKTAKKKTHTPKSQHQKPPKKGQDKSDND